jgi:NAD(P)-dependent dehydrogenase (short-subunit alcohol dehydrogenase family)
VGRDSAQVRAMFDTLKVRAGRGDIVISNAGL